MERDGCGGGKVCPELNLQECCVAAKVCYAEHRVNALVNSTMESTNINSNPQKIVAVVGAATIALGFVPVPLTDPSLSKASQFEWAFAFLPLLPLALVALSVVSRRRMPVVLAKTLALIILIAGAFTTFLMMAFSGGGAVMMTLHGVALTLACATSILLISTLGKKAGSVVFGLYMFPVLIGIWSLAMVPFAYSSAVEISSGRAFCIGEHSPVENELSFIIGLRGLSFYTTRSGYKAGDAWYFHGLLLVEDDGATRVYNWSPRSMQFQAVERPELLFVTPLNSCVPKEKFLQELELI